MKLLLLRLIAFLFISSASARRVGDNLLREDGENDILGQRHQKARDKNERKLMGGMKGPYPTHTKTSEPTISPWPTVTPTYYPTHYPTVTQAPSYHKSGSMMGGMSKGKGKGGMGKGGMGKGGMSKGGMSKGKGGMSKGGSMMGKGKGGMSKGGGSMMGKGKGYYWPVASPVHTPTASDGFGDDGSTEPPQAG